MPQTFPAPLPPEKIEEFFPKDRQDPIKPGAFEIGLALGGTVSAGAYTAGVLDFLIEALDAWTKAKEENKDYAPRHEVVVSTMAGASGGAINGALLLRAAAAGFPHGTTEANPFFSVWTRGVDLNSLLSPDPEPGVSGFASLLNCKPLDAMAAIARRPQSPALGANNSPRQRSYLADPLRHVMMVGNLTGVPYRIQFKGVSGLSHHLLSHADHLRFGLTVPGGVPNPPSSRPDETALSCSSPLSWDKLEAGVLATCAFPAAFRSRKIDRPLEVFGYKVAVVPNGEGSADIEQLIPNWEILAAGNTPPAPLSFFNVDGGTVNNEPFDIVRMALAGYAGRNKRGGLESDRAVILIDPFSDPEKLGLSDPKKLGAGDLPSVPQAVGALAMALVFQNRFKPVDVALAKRDDVYSRFLVAPSRPSGIPADPLVRGDAAIASGGLAGFLGFLDKRFLEFDFKLGRRNAYEFLAGELLLPEGNKLFTEANWPSAKRAPYRKPFKDSQGQDIPHLPLIPLMPDLPVPPEISPTDWPVLDEMPDGLEGSIRDRLQVIYRNLIDDLTKKSWWANAGLSTLAWPLWKVARPYFTDMAMSAIKGALVKQGLLRE